MRRVCDIMTEDVATASPDTTLDEIARMMRDEDTGAIPVVEDDELVGIITDRDIVIRCIAEQKQPSDVAAEEILSEQLEVVEPDADVEEAARIMAADPPPAGGEERPFGGHGLAGRHRRQSGRRRSR